MALPRIDAPTYEVTLPVSKKQVRFRPFLVKEQKILLMAMESNDKNEVENNVHQIIQNCIMSNDINIEDLPIADIEFFFLQLRARSVGEVVDTRYKCEHDVGGQPCGNIMKTSFNILDLKVQFPEQVANDIRLTDTIGIKMRYPTFKVTKRIQKEDSVTKTAFELILDCIEYIYDADAIYYTNETSREEMMAFLESLTKSQFEKIEKFIDSMPKMNKKIEMKCGKCGFEHEIDLEGLESFFE